MITRVDSALRPAFDLRQMSTALFRLLSPARPSVGALLVPFPIASAPSTPIGTAAGHRHILADQVIQVGFVSNHQYVRRTIQSVPPCPNK